MIRKCFLYASFLVFILGCAPLAQFKDLTNSDFIWDQKTVQGSYQDVYRRILKGFRDCDWQGIYFLENNLYSDTSEGEFLVFSNGGLPGVKARGPYVIGQILIKADGSSHTKVRAGVVPYWKKGTHEPLRTTEWLRMAEGDYSWCDK